MAKLNNLPIHNIFRYLILVTFLTGSVACVRDPLATTEADALKAGLQTLQENETAVAATRKGLQKELSAMTLKDPARLDVLEKDLRCKKALEKIGFTKRQYKRRLKALKAGQAVPKTELTPEFTCG